MRVLHTIAGASPEHGGPSRSVPRLCEALAADGHQVRFVTVARTEGTSSLPAPPVESFAAQKEGVEGLFRNPFSFWQKLEEAVRDGWPDVIHDHGMWLPSNWIAAHFARRHDVPLVISPRGMLTERALDNSSLKKRVAWFSYQKRTLESAALFHATGRADVTSLRKRGLTQPVAVIPNAVTPPKELAGRRSGNERRALFLSRLHPIKGLPTFIRAWDRVRPEGWTLELVGPDEEGHRDELEGLVRDLGLTDSVIFSGPVYDDEKWDKYRAADLFVLPSHSESFGMVVVEALAAGIPVITTTGAPWQELETHDCGWWVEPDLEALAGALSAATGRSERERAAMGERGRELVEQRYRWSSVARQMTAVYGWVRGQGAKPECIQENQ